MDEFYSLSPEQRRIVHFILCEHALEKWLAYVQGIETIEYIESVVGTHQVLDKHLPSDALQAARQGTENASIAHRYQEPITAMQDEDLVFPEPVTYAYYAIYNLFKRYAQHDTVDDWLIVNQALAAEEQRDILPSLLSSAIGRARQFPGASILWQLWHHDLFDRETPPSLEASGENILPGLYALWQHTLAEGVQDNGNATFSHFHLSWGHSPSARLDIFVNPEDNISLQKLRQWAGLMTKDQKEAVDIHTNQPSAHGNPVLSRLAHELYELLQNSSRWTADAINTGAEASSLLARIESMASPQDLFNLS